MSGDGGAGVDGFDSVLLFVTDLALSRAFYVDVLGLGPVLLDDDIAVVLSLGASRLVLHRHDRGHDERGVWPVGWPAGASALRFSVDDPDLWQQRLEDLSMPIIWPVQDASWGRFVLTADPDGRPIALARMTR